MAKYYGTNTILYGDYIDKIRSLGYKGTHNQFRIVCKANSRAEANRIAESYGLSEKTFHGYYTSETGNTVELELADKYTIIVCTGGTIGVNYVALSEII